MGEGWFVTSFNIYIHEVKKFASQIMFPLLQLRKFYFGRKFRAKNKKSADICYLYINDLQQKIQVAKAVAEEVVQVQGEDSTRYIQDVDS